MSILSAQFIMFDAYKLYSIHQSIRWSIMITYFYQSDSARNTVEYHKFVADTHVLCLVFKRNIEMTV